MNVMLKFLLKGRILITMTLRNMATKRVEDVPLTDVPVIQDQSLDAYQLSQAITDTPAETMNMSTIQIATAMTCLCACVFISALDITIVTTALPTIAAEFGSNASYTWIGTAFTLAHTASTPSWGKLSDIWGRKHMLLCSNALFFAGSLICALVKDMGAFVAGRAIQGLGAGGMSTVVNICIGDMFSQRDRGLYYGMTSLVWALASGVGPVMGGVFTTKLNWRWCFWINRESSRIRQRSLGGTCCEC